MTSPGCSNMLSDLLNLLRGREGGPVGFLMLPALRGDPFARDTLVWRLKGLGLDESAKALGYALRSWGEDVKHSSNDGVEAPEDGNESIPAPNLNAGQLFSFDLKDTVLVE